MSTYLPTCKIIHRVTANKIFFKDDPIKIHSWTLGRTMLSYALINSHSQVRAPVPEGPLVYVSQMK